MTTIYISQDISYYGDEATANDIKKFTAYAISYCTQHGYNYEILEHDSPRETDDERAIIEKIWAAWILSLTP